MKKGLSEVIIILDRSGSMSTTWSDAVGGLKTLIADQKKQPGELLVTMVVFDDIYQMLYSGKNIDNIGDDPFCGEHISPRNTTALYDAVGKTFASVGSRLAKTAENERPERVLVAVITDGMENASKEYTGKTIKEAIELQRTKYSWEVIFMGADENALAVANNMSVHTVIRYANTHRGQPCLYGTFSSALSHYRSVGTTNLSGYTDLTEDSSDEKH